MYPYKTISTGPSYKTTQKQHVGTNLHTPYKQDSAAGRDLGSHRGSAIN